eukprot:TRINITY_DN4934_c0_g1::TRINITY_DN4934_c0_g1_i1::g.16646::m.16646 TRINITY_DN4934_c0_g1::TRINITY_DN4934_c0_g1_i1::g.16646  ORF type:complete len:173 (-),score=10.38,sp/P32320/CDD_HUMAN/41.04/4e-30,dCMP_cyt_deam_1/PF00383.17/1.8e-15,dCMP_cyt_deam_2/PF08211.6/4.5e-10 TRINITY_DN4934_c0_g1_i1:233-712(-)
MVDSKRRRNDDSDEGLLEKETLNMLIDAAIEVKSNSWSPYSHFRVGCAVLTDDMSIYKGTNVENASYGMTVCAERVAVFNAVSHGHKKIVAAVVSTDVKDCVKWCCGACTSVLLEFGQDIVVYSVRPDRTYEWKYIRDLAPFAFCRADLDAPRVALPSS